MKAGKIKKLILSTLILSNVGWAECNEVHVGWAECKEAQHSFIHFRCPRKN